MLTSVIIRTYNEQKYLDQLLRLIHQQECKTTDLEVIIVDSGSTDATLDIASKHRCNIVHIKKEDFTYGRALNLGCEIAMGDFLVFVSGHCLPVDSKWLDELILPLISANASYSYGRQLGFDTTKFSESQFFTKNFPVYSKIPQDGFFCNNANAAISRQAWKQFKFNEQLTGLEDMYLAKQLVENNQKIAYSSSSMVYHIHNESWRQVRIRYEREAYALHRIMPEVHFTVMDFIRYFISGVVSDSIIAIRQRCFFQKFYEILMFRLMHYWGTYQGNHLTRKLSARLKYRYFYPKDVEEHLYEKKDSSFVTNESK